MTIESLQERVKKDWDKAGNLPTREQQILFIIEELGEVAEAIRKQDGTDYKKGSADLGSEFADLIISLTTLANTCNIDLSREIDGFWQKLESRR